MEQFIGLGIKKCYETIIHLERSVFRNIMLESSVKSVRNVTRTHSSTRFVILFRSSTQPSTQTSI